MSLWSHRVTSLGNGTRTINFSRQKTREANELNYPAGPWLLDVGVQGVLDASIRD
jgi:hypothetical protein